MNKRTYFIRQPMYGQLINLLNKEEIFEFSRVDNVYALWMHLIERDIAL